MWDALRFAHALGAPRVRTNPAMARCIMQPDPRSRKPGALRFCISMTVSSILTARPLGCRSLTRTRAVYNISAVSEGRGGGVARFQTAIKQYAHLDPLILFSGDCFSPSVMSTMTKGTHMVPVLNALGVTLAMYGNHDFDFGIEAAVKLTSGTNFPWMLANIHDNRTGKPLGGAHQTRVLDYKGVKIGVLAVAEDWTNIMPELPPEGVKYHDIIEYSRMLVKRLESQGCDLIIALTHSRLPTDEKLAAEVQGIDLILGGHDHLYVAKQVAPFDQLIVKSGADFRDFTVIDVELQEPMPPPAARQPRRGHRSARSSSRSRERGAPDAMFPPPNISPASSPNASPYRAGRPLRDKLGKMKPLDLDPGSPLARVKPPKRDELCVTSPHSHPPSRSRSRAGSIEDSKGLVRCKRAHFTTKRVRVGCEVPEDKDMLALVKRVSRDVEAKLNVQLGVFEVDLDTRFDRVRRVETAVGNFLADLILAAYPQVDVGYMVGGCIRSNTLYKAGPFKFRQLFAILPFQDPVMVTRITGEQLIRCVEHGVSSYPKLDGRFPHLGGMRFVFDPKQPSKSRVLEAYRVSKDGKEVPIDRKKMYVVGTRAYLVGGGDGYDELSKGTLLVTEAQGTAPPRLLRNLLWKIDAVNRARTTRARLDSDTAPKLIRIAPQIEGRILTAEMRGEAKRKGQPHTNQPLADVFRAAGDIIHVDAPYSDEQVAVVVRNLKPGELATGRHFDVVKENGKCSKSEGKAQA